MPEIVINLHMHTSYSDGCGNHHDIVKAAQRAKIDAVITTDHNILVNGVENTYTERDQKVILLIGEEVHDQSRSPQKNHLLVIGCDREMAQYANDLNLLLEQIRSSNGLSFLAHPHDPASPSFGEEDISWENWDINHFTGMEIWNSLSEFKSLLKSKFHGIYYAYQPEKIASGPDARVLQKWDQLLVEGRRIVAIGGSDAHNLKIKVGPFRRTIFPYEWHFRGINTHLILPELLKGDFQEDKLSILNALRQGNAFIGYDLPANTKGFRFTANSLNGNINMGEETSSKGGVTFQIRLPRPTECRLIHNGQVIKTWEKREILSHTTVEPGAYRVEAYLQFAGKRRGWIFSNPIYITK